MRTQLIEALKEAEYAWRNDAEARDYYRERDEGMFHQRADAVMSVVDGYDAHAVEQERDQAVAEARRLNRLLREIHAAMSDFSELADRLHEELDAELA
jgi:hypothetical protein